MGVPSVQIRKSTREIVKFDDYPREDMGPVSGLDPDLEWLVIHIPYSEPTYDSRIWLLNENKPDLQFLDKFLPHPLYPSLREYRITYGLTKRPIPDIQTSILNAENDANNQVFPYTKQLKNLALGIGVIFRHLDGMTLTAKETAVKDKCMAIAVNIWKNDATMRAKVAEIAAGREPNIDADWTKTEPA